MSDTTGRWNIFSSNLSDNIDCSFVCMYAIYCFIMFITMKWNCRPNNAECNVLNKF